MKTSKTHVDHSGIYVNKYATMTLTTMRYPCFKNSGDGQKNKANIPTTCHNHLIQVLIFVLTEKLYRMKHSEKASM